MPEPASGIDHLVYAAASLEQGMDAIEALLGVPPVRGGQHPQYGTHNALLSLGPATYLEVIAPDPGLPAPVQGVLAEILPDEAPRLLTWVLRVSDIAAAASATASIGIGSVQSGSRVTPSGETISWQLTDPYAMPMEGAIPFLIDWGGSTHPATVAPAAGRFMDLHIEHPDPAAVREALATLGFDATVQQAASCRLTARIETTDGIRELC
jgi:hypothetical protein